MANKTIYPYGTNGQLPSSIGIINDLTTGGIDKALSAEMGKEIGLDLGLSLRPFESIQHIIGTTTPSASGTRYSLLFNVEVGMRIKAQSSWGAGIYAAIYATRDIALVGAVNTILQGFPDGDYSTAEHSGVVHVAGVLRIGAKKDTAFTESDIADFLSSLTFDIIRDGNIKGQFEDVYATIKNGSTPLFLGNLVQKSMTYNGLADSTTRVSTASCMVIPHEQATLKFKLPQYIYVGIRSGNEASNLSRNEYWYGDGDTFTFDSTVHYFRLCFAYSNNIADSNPTYNNISVATINGYIEGGDIQIEVNNEPSNIISRNYDNEKYIKAAMRNFVSGASNNGSLRKLPIFAHTSDVHGDASRFNSFADYCDYLGVDGALVTGDTVASTPSNAMQYINDIADTHNTEMLICMGNHDAYNLTTAETQYNTIMKHIVEKYSVITNPDETYPTYYYKDFTSKNIRLISLNLYELNHNGHSCYFSQAQCTWLVSVLASTPQNYGVLIMFHSPEKMPAKDNDHAAFYQDIVNYTSLQDGTTGNPFTQIVDAFIGKTAATINYTSKSTSISVSADFTNVASGVEFIAFVNGHLHVDRIGYSPSTTYKQLNLNVCCGIAIYGSTYPYLANNSDMPRGCTGSTQDAFNIYAIDRATKTVRIARVGSNVAGTLVERKYMEIPYAD